MVSTSEGGLERQSWECLGPVGSSPISLASYIPLCLVLFLNITCFTYHCCWYCFSTSLTLHIPLLPVLFFSFTHFIHTIVASTVSQFNSRNGTRTSLPILFLSAQPTLQAMLSPSPFLAGCNGTENNYYFQSTLLWLK